MRIDILQVRVLVLLLQIWSSASVLNFKEEKKVVCFYSGESLNILRTEFTGRDLDPNLCTHLVYPYASLDDNDKLEVADYRSGRERGNDIKFSYLKSFNSKLKTMLSLGRGISQKLSTIAADKDRRISFAKNTLTFLRENWFDGINFDWQHPGSKYGSPADKTNYVLLLQAFREEFEQENNITGHTPLQLSIDVPHNIKILEDGFDLRSLSKYLDFMNVFTFNYHFPVEADLSHRASLFPSTDFGAQMNIDFTIKHILNTGVQKDKIILGIPTYGRTLILYEPDKIYKNTPVDELMMEDTMAKSEGTLPYNEICKMLKSEGWRVEKSSPKTVGPYAQRDNFLVSYDDPDSVKLKAQYAVKEGLGGLMFWAIDFEDYNGECYRKRFPLIAAGKEILAASILEPSANIVLADKMKALLSSFTSGKSDSEMTISTSSNTQGKRISFRMVDQYAIPGLEKDASDFSRDLASNLFDGKNELASEDLVILQQLISLVKRLGGIHALEKILGLPQRSYDDTSTLNTNIRKILLPQPDSYGREVGSYTVTSPPLTLRRAPLPIVLSNFTVHIDTLNIDSSAFGKSS